MEHPRVLLADVLLQRVRIERIRRHRLDQRHLPLLAVHRRRSRVHHAPDFPIARRDQHVQRPDHVGHVRFDRLGDRKRNSRQRGDVEHRIDSVEGIVDRGGVADIGFDKLGRSVHIVAAASGEVVDHPHAHSRGDERVHEMRSDKAGAARYQDETSRRLRLRVCAHRVKPFATPALRRRARIGQNCAVCIARIT